MKQKVITIILGALGVALLGTGVYLYLNEDRVGPVISFNGDISKYQEGSDESVLLEFVTAYDEVDKDVSDSLRIESIYPLEGEGKARVVFVARDSSDNITKAEKIIEYVGAGSGTIITESDEESDEDTVAETKEAEETEDTDETAETESDDALSKGIPVLELNTHSTTLNRGQSFIIQNFVESIKDDKDTENELYRTIKVKSETGITFDTNYAGTYNLIVYVIDSDGNPSNEEELKVIVK